jgi:hypothetical protein
MLIGVPIKEHTTKSIDITCTLAQNWNLGSLEPKEDNLIEEHFSYFPA